MSLDFVQLFQCEYLNEHKISVKFSLNKVESIICNMKQKDELK